MAIERPFIPFNLAIGLGLTFLLCGCAHTRKLLGHGGQRAATTRPDFSAPGRLWKSPVQNAEVIAYIKRYKTLAMEQMRRYKIPASITLAQGIFESGFGLGELARLANNHFGIKCHDWEGPYVKHDDDAKGECFRKYDNARESFADHAHFLKGSERYRKLFRLRIDDYKGWAYGLKKAGYATDKTYAMRLIRLIETYQLQRFDQLVLKGEPPPARRVVVSRAEERSPQPRPVQEDEIRESF